MRIRRIAVVAVMAAATVWTAWGQVPNGDASVDYTEPSWQLYNDRPYRQDESP
jgi:hypothetical protein